MSINKRIGLTEMVAKVKRSIAEDHYRQTGDASRLLDLGIDPATVKRPTGRPSKTTFDDRDIVQLVWNQKYQGGEKFSNTAGVEKNPCFLAVAEAQGRHVSAIIRQWKRVPAADRQRIGEWVREMARDLGCLHQRHK